MWTEKRIFDKRCITGRMLTGIAIMGLLNVVDAQDAQWRGPERNGCYPDSLLLKEWPEEGPEIVFVAGGIGRGFSSAVSSGELIYVTGTVDSTEYLTALDLQGKQVWQKPYGPSWNQSVPEARCTPAVEGDRVYVLSGLDQMACINSINGEEIWSVNIHDEYESNWDMFGVSESLLLVDDKVIATPAGEKTTVIALDKMTGKLVWESESLSAQRSNMSPALIEHCGQSYIITSTRTNVIGVDPVQGEILWTYHYNILDDKGENTTILANTPIYSDSCLWISDGWDRESVMLEIAPDGRSVTEKFLDRTFDNQNHGVVLVDGFLYGSNFTDRNNGRWVCMNWRTGEITWLGEFHNKGPIIYADGMLYICEEKRGHMGLVKASPDSFDIISSFRVSEGNGPYWARPTIYNGTLLVRHGDKLIGYMIRGNA
jgi:outer membrane protein assembly factor BamB